MSIVQHNLFLDSTEADFVENYGSRATFLLDGGFDIGGEQLFLSLLSANLVFNEPNIIEGKNNVFYWIDNTDQSHNYEFETGLYSIEQINTEITQLMIDIYDSSKQFMYTFKPDTATGKSTVQIRELGWSIDCNHDNNILKILGFLPTQGINGIVTGNTDNQIIDSKANIMINSLRNYIVTCNLISDSWLNKRQGDCIASFSPDVDPYSQFTYQSLHLSHIPINRNSKIDKIVISFFKQDGTPCDFQGGNHNEGVVPESWYVRLRISNVLSN